MKKTETRLARLFALLLCLTVAIGALALGTAAESSFVSAVTVDKDKVLNEATPFLVDTGSGYAVDDGLTLLGTYPWVAQFDPASGLLVLQNYNGGAISTSATGNLTIRLMGENTVLHTEVGICLYGGELTVTAEEAATLEIQNVPSTSFSDEAAHYTGIANNFENGYATAERSGDSITITGKADVSITSTKKYASGSCNGIGAYGNIMVLGNASLSIEADNQYSNLAAGFYSLGGTIVVNTTGDVHVAVCGEGSYDIGENLFRGAQGAVLGAVGNMTLNWTYPNFYEECEIEYGVDLTDENYVIGTLPDDATSKTYAYKFPITVTGGVAKVDGVEITSASKGETVTVEADAPEAGMTFMVWNATVGEVTFADKTESTTTFTMIGGEVELESAYEPLYGITVNHGTASVSKAPADTIVTITADDPETGYQFAGWMVTEGGVTLTDASALTTSFLVEYSNVTVTATYAPIEYNVTVTDGTASIEETDVTVATIEDTVTITANDPAIGYVFQEWQITAGSCTIADATSATTTFHGLSSDVTIVAVYKKATFTVTTERASATKDGEPVTSAQIDDVFTITAEERAGATFNGWSVSGGSVADADSTTTFTADGTGNITITPVYNYTDYTVSIEDGKGFVNGNDNEITDANVDESIIISADSPASEYAFIRWEIVSGAVTLEDPTASSTTFTMIAGNVELRAVYAKIIKLDRLDFTMIAPTVGAHPSFVLTPAEPTKYGIDTVHIYLYEDPYPDLTDADVYLLGKGYELELRFELQNGYELADNAKFYVNDVEMTDNGTYTKRYYFEFPVPITVTGGKAYADGDYTEQITEGRNQWVYLRADEAPEGKVFKYWKVLSGNVTIDNPTNEETYFEVGEESVEIAAIFATPLEEMHFTIPDFARGENVNLTVNSAEPEKYWAENVVVEIYSVGTPLTPSDKYLPLTEYQITFDVVTADGSIVASETVKTLNGKTLYGNYYESSHWAYLETTGAVTVTGGTAYADSERTEEITEAESNDYVYVTAADPEPGKVFVKWLVKKGDVSMDTTSSQTYFRIDDEEVELEAVYATVLTEVTLTVPKPAVGAPATTSISSADPSKYTASLIEFYLYYGNQTLLPTDLFSYGETCVMKFEILPAEGYAVTEDTVVTVNDDETYAYGGYTLQRWTFQLPKSITVTGGTAYANSERTEEIGELYNAQSIYLKADPAPEGKKFMMWRINQDGNVFYLHTDQTDTWISGKVVTAESVYAIPIEKIELTMPTITIGSTPITTITDESDLYDAEVESWYYYDEESTRQEMLPTDTYQANIQYYCNFRILPVEGYQVPYSGATYLLNGEQFNTSGYISGTNIVGGRQSFMSLVYVTINGTGGKLYLDGVETNETKFLPGTELTLVADESLFPEGQVFYNWYISTYNSSLIGSPDTRFASLTFTVGTPVAFDQSVALEAQYQTVTQLNYGPYTEVPHPTVGGTPSYDTEVPSYQNYYGEVLGWYEGETLLEPTHVFEAGKVYTVKLRLTPAAGYRFRDAEYYDTYDPYNSFNGTDVDGILLECDEDGAYIVFAVSVQARHHEDSASVTVTAPVAGKAPDKTVTKSPDTYCDVAFNRWEVYDEEAEKYREMLDGELFEVGKTYRISVDFTTNETHYIDLYDLVVLINDTEPSYRGGGTAAGGYSTCGYYLQFTVEAGESYDITVDGGTASIDETPVTEVGGGVTVTLTANAPEAGKAFKGWEIVSGENVLILDATAETTTFVMPAGDVSIQAVYRNIPHAITVEGGTPDMDEAGSGETVTVTADDAPDGKYFAGWECVSGGVTFADANAKTTTFVMSAEAVTITAVYADKTVLSEVNLTVPAPAGGALPSEDITSSEPTKYTAVVNYWYSFDTNATMEASDEFVYGSRYELRFSVVLSEQYTVDSNTVFNLNGKATGCYSKTVDRQLDFKVPVPITVEGGSAIDAYGNPLTEQISGDYVELIAGEIPEGKCFLCWEVVSGDVSINSAALADGAYFYVDGNDAIAVRAVYHTHVYDEYTTNTTNHWKECTDQDCPDSQNGKKDDAEHTGGTATCTEQATCSVCGVKYGSLAEHQYTTVHGYKGADGHANTCACGAKGAVTPHTPDRGAATETEPVKCSVCEYVITPALGHVHTNHLEKVTASPATCTEDGNIEYYTCSCGKWFTTAAATEEITDHASVTIPAAHTYGDLIEQVNPTHTSTELAAGMQAHYFCDVCDTYFTEGKVATTEDALIIPAPTHNYSTVHGYKGADGHANTCACGAKDAVTPHTPDIPNPTEGQDQKCSACEYVIAPALNHVHTNNLTRVAASPATCTEDGNIEYYTCSCGKWFTTAAATEEITDHASVTIPAAHTYGDLIEQVNPTHTSTELAAGMQAHYFCDVCDTYFTEGKVATTESALIIPAPTHNYSTVHGYKGADGHANTCACGAKGAVTPHTPDRGAATETEPVKCSVCEYVITPATGHVTCSGGIAQPGKAATCTEPGYKEYYKCSGCEKLYEEAACTTPIADLEAWKLGDGKTTKAHDHGTAWESDANNHWNECECGDKANVAPHVDSDTDGKCDVCDHDVPVTPPSHTHDHGTAWESDANNHWNECECGDKANVAPHVDSNSNGKCDVCEHDVPVTPPASNGSETKLEHTQSGTTVEIPTGSSAMLPEGTELAATELPKTDVSEQTVEKIEEKADGNVTVLAYYDLSLLLNGATVQPNGKLLVTLPAITGDFDRVKVLYVSDDGSVEECVTTQNEDGTIAFETDHFSKYVVVGVNDEKSGGLSAGAIVGIVIGAVLLVGIGGFAIWWFVIEKKTFAQLKEALQRLFKKPSQT